MKTNTLKHYTKLRRQLLDEKNELEARLQELNAALGMELPPAPASAPRAPRRGRPPGGGAAAGNTMSLRKAVIKALSSGPVARQDLVRAVESTGYRFKTDKPLNSIGSVVYAKDTPVKKTADGRFFVTGTSSAASETANEASDSGSAPVKRRKRKVSSEARAKMAASQKARREREKNNTRG